MEVIEEFQRLALALAIGILVGIERGWQNRDLEAGGRVAGIRTYALAGFLGGLAGFLNKLAGPIIPAAMLLAYATAFAAFSFRESSARHDHSVTSVVAALVVFSLGFMAVVSDMRLAAAGAVATAGLLAARHSLHGFLKNLTWAELRSALVLLAMSFVALPLLPNRTIDPWDAFNPFEIWLMTIFIAAISYVGYLAVRIAGTRFGILFAGAAAGFVSSTAVTLSFARLSVEKEPLSRRLASAAAIAGALSLSRALVISGFLAPALLPGVMAALLPAIAVFAGVSFWLIGRSGESKEQPDLSLENPFELWTVLRFGALLGVVSFLSKVMVEALGSSSIVAIALVSGIPDVDAITLSIVRLASNSVPLSTAALAILCAASVNLITKTVMAVSFGTRSYGRILFATTLAAISIGAATYATLYPVLF